jgi:APA family basic amino acid/polyamine antiporter
MKAKKRFSNAKRRLAPAGDVNLRRDLGLLDAVGIGFGAIIGAGIFVVTGIAAGVAGPAFLLSLLVAGIAATANALSSAELAANYPQSGGTYEYGYRVLNPWLGFAAGWMFLASKIAAAGTVALGLAGYLEMLRPGLPPRVIAVGAIVVFTIVNYLGVRKSSRMNLAIISVSLGSLLLFVVAGLGSFNGENFQPFAPAGWRGVLEGSALLFFAYTGYARIATLGEEVRHPRSTIPKAIIISLAASACLYVAVAAIATGAVGTARLSGTAAPLGLAARSFTWPEVAKVVAVGGVTAMLGVIQSQILGLSRMAFAMSRRGDLPAFLEHIHARFGTPGRAVLLIGVVSGVVAATGTLKGIASGAAFTILIYYGIANLAAIRMPREKKLYPNFIPGMGLLSCGLLAISLDSRTILIGCAVLAAGTILRWGRVYLLGESPRG